MNSKKKSKTFCRIHDIIWKKQSLWWLHVRVQSLLSFSFLILLLSINYDLLLNLKGFKDAFRKYTFDEADVQGFKYDLTSIMHYENSAFTNGYCRPTMLVKKDPSYEVTPVYLRKFSPQDIQKINKLYSCQTNQLPPTGKLESSWS